MSMEASMNSSSAQNESVKTESSQMDMVVIAKRQRFQDIVFHRLTQTFSLLVLLALTGIIASLFINAWPAFQKFGINFIWRVEWDIVNEEFGAAISIVGTLASAGIAMLIAGESSIREVIAFPKNKEGKDPLTGAPSPVPEEQLRELGLMVVRP